MQEMAFEQALMSMKAGLKVFRAAIIEDPCIPDHCWAICQNRICKIYIENGLICKMPLTEDDILAKDWFILTEDAIDQEWIILTEEDVK